MEERKNNAADDAKIVCLQEGRTYNSLDCLAKEISAQLSLVPCGEKIVKEITADYEKCGFVGFVRGLKESLQKHHLISGEEDEADDDLENSFKVKYIGLYVYTDAKGHELVIYFAPKFVHAEKGIDAENVDAESVKNRRAQLLDRYDRVLLAIDRYQKDQARIDASWNENADSRVGLLPLVVMLIRDYLEHGLYTVHYNELERNGQGEIDWERTISGEQPFIQSGRPVYMDYWTEQTLSDENNYFTQLHACLLSVWGKKLAEWGLADVLNASIPSLSESELDEFGDEDYILSRIHGELGRQFVTHSRRTLQMIEALVAKTFEAEVLDEHALSFGMGGVAALWEEAINRVLGTQLDCRICECCGVNNPKTFRDSIPYPIWYRITDGVGDKYDRKIKESNTWRPDFVRVWKPAEETQPVFVILDAKYYSVVWNQWGHIQGEPGIESISKQFFYKKAYQGLINELGATVINAFVFPALGEDQDIEMPKVAARIGWSEEEFCKKMFGSGDLHAVKLSGLRLLDAYASFDDDKDEWMAEIVRLCRYKDDAGPRNDGDAETGKANGGDTTGLPPESPVGIDRPSEVLPNDLNADNQEVTSAPLVDAQGNMPQDGGGVVPPIDGDCISKEFIRDVMSIPSYSGREEMMREYIIQFAQVRGIAFKEDLKGNLYLTKGKPTKENGYYPCLVNHMDTAQDKHLPYIKSHKRLEILERENGNKQTEFYVKGMGIGADDKSGCAIALALLDQLPVAKAAFFVEEEKGMLGSEQLDRGWFNDVGFCLSFDSPERNRSSKTCAGVQLYSDYFFEMILKPVCYKNGITVFRHEPLTDIVQIRKKTPIMCYNVGNGGSHPPHQSNEYLIVKDAQLAYKFGFDLLSKIGENRYWFGDEESGGSGGGDPPKCPDQPVAPVSGFSEGTGDSNPVPSSTPDVCNCRKAADASKAKTAALDSPKKGGDLEGGSAVDATTDTARTQTKERQIMPGLRIYHGGRIEDLAEKLVAELNGERKDPFEFLKVAVANPNLGNWLKMKVLAKVPELSAGIEMPFLEERLAELVKANYTGKLELISGRDYPALILDALMNHWRKEFVPFRKYIKEEFDPSSEQKNAAEGAQKEANPDEVPLQIVSQREARKAVQLADKLAQLVDAYEATGNLGTLEKNKDENAVYGGEQALAETLFGSEKEKGLLPKNGKISLRQMFDVVKARKPQGKASRVVLFGHTSLTDLQIKILVWLSQTHEVVWYCPANINCVAGNEASAYNADVIKTIAKLKQNIDNAKLSPEAIKRTQAANRVLDHLQAKLAYGAADGKVAQDASVQIVGTPGIRREVEMVYNAILGAVWDKNEDGKPQAKKGMSFSDIAVLVPDMLTYRPMIEAVFDGRGQIPYGLVDATTQDYSTYLDGFLALMDIARYGLSRKRIFMVLENPCVQRAMGFSRDDVIAWRELAEDFGAYEGYNVEDSDEGNVSGHFNWEWALRRMRLGLVAQDVGVKKGSDDKLPLEARDVDAVYKFSEVVETLYRKLDALNKMSATECSSTDAAKLPETWAGRLHAVMDEFLAVDKDDGLESLVRARIVKTLNGLTAIKSVQTYKLPVAMVEHCVAGTECAKGGYLRHGVTIGGLRSLAHVPFKQIFVLGLGEGGLPGKNDCSTLDVRNEKKVEDRHDVLRPEENRARFLAAVLSARDRLVLSYPNRELGSNAKLYPSSVVNDLKGALSQVISIDFKEFKGYPLTEFAGPIQTPDGQVWSAISGEQEEDCFKGLLPSLSRKAYALAGYDVANKNKIENKGVDKEDVAQAEEAPRNDTAEKNEFAEPTPKDLAEFVKDPFTAILKRRLGIETEGYRDHTLDDASPLGVRDGEPLWDLQKEMVLKRFDLAFVDKQKRASVPSDFLGDFECGKLAGTAVFWDGTTEVTEQDRRILDSGQSTENLSVVCRPFSEGTEDDPITLPPNAVLIPLFERLKKCTVERFGGRLEFQVKVLDVEGEKIGIWQFDLDFSKKPLLRYYDMVKSMYLNCLVCKKFADSYPTFTYDELLKCLRTPNHIPSDLQGWRAVTNTLIMERAKKEYWRGNKNKFNNSHVVSRVVERFKREPTGFDMMKLFKRLYKVPMSGRKVVAGGAQ